MEELLNQFIASSRFPMGDFVCPIPSLGKLINRKDMTQNKNSEKGYRNVVLNISSTNVANVACSTSILVIPCQTLLNCLCIFTFSTTISQCTIGDRFGTNACIPIAVKFGAFYLQTRLFLSLLRNQLQDM